MRDLDEIDLEIVRLLLADGRRPYNDIAERVELSAPAVKDRVDRLRELGIIRQFTIRVDRDVLSRARPMLIRLTPSPRAVDAVFDELRTLEAVEHTYRMADGTVYAHAYLPTDDAVDWLAAAIDLDAVTAIEAQPIASHAENAGIQPEAFDLTCVVCGNDVDTGGELARFDGSVKAFCCESCLARYEQRYEAHRREVG